MWLYYKLSLLFSKVYCPSKKYWGKRKLILAHPMKLWELDPTFRAPPVLNLSFVNQLFFSVLMSGKYMHLTVIGRG